MPKTDVVETSAVADSNTRASSGATSRRHHSTAGPQRAERLMCARCELKVSRAYRRVWRVDRVAAADVDIDDTLVARGATACARPCVRRYQHGGLSIYL
jgi:hypothetical protein